MTIHYASHLELAKSALRMATECASTGDYDRAVELLREVETEAARSVIGIRQWQEDRMRLEGAR